MLLLVAISKKLCRLVGESDQRLAEASPETSWTTAALLREAMPRLSGERQRQLAEELASRFELRAGARSQPSSV
jgi:predicted DNA-binding protein